MEPFLQLALSFPVLPFSLVMGVVFLYWLAVIIGAADLDLFDGDGAAHALTGKAEALAGKAEALAGKAEALAGKAEALTGKAEALAGKSEALGAESHGLLDVVGLGGVPITVSGSVLAFTGWTFSLLGMGLLAPALPALVPDLLVKGGIFVGSAALALAASSLAIRPLRPLFRFKHAPSRRTLLGRTCVIESGSVDGTHGRATVEDGGAGLVVQVVCGRDNPLKRGDRALLIDFDPRREVYEVEPVDWLLPEELASLPDPTQAEAFMARARERQD